MTEQLADNLFRIEVPLPGNPLKSLNSYLIRTDGRCLLIDTGFNMPACRDALREGLAELEVDLARTDLFCTHHHADHCGLIGDLIGPDNRAYMHRLDAAIIYQGMRAGADYFDQVRDLAIAIGFPPAGFDKAASGNPIVAFAPQPSAPFAEVEEGDEIVLDDAVRLRVLHTPGHTEGHACLYWEEREILFCGDLVLYTITPNITDWEDQDALGHYFDSLKRVRGLRVRQGLAAHRQNGKLDFAVRIDQLLDHHQVRLREVRDILEQTPGLTPFEIAARMKWSIRARNWEEFPPNQMWFAVGEALAHIVHLQKQELVRLEMDGRLRRYFLTEADQIRFGA